MKAYLDDRDNDRVIPVRIENPQVGDDIEIGTGIFIISHRRWVPETIEAPFDADRGYADHLGMTNRTPNYVLYLRVSRGNL